MLGDIMSDDMKEIIDIDLAGDVNEFIKINEDVDITPELKTKIENFDNMDLVKVTKQIGSFTKILNVELVDDELLEKEL